MEKADRDRSGCAAPSVYGQCLDDVMIIDDLAVPAAGMVGPAADQSEHRAGAEETFKPVIIEAHAQTLADQPRGDGVENLAQDERAG